MWKTACGSQTLTQAASERDAASASRCSSGALASLLGSMAACKLASDDSGNACELASGMGLDSVSDTKASTRPTPFHQIQRVLY